MWQVFVLLPRKVDKQTCATHTQKLIHTFGKLFKLYYKMVAQLYHKTFHSS